MKRKLRMGMVGGGQGAFIGAVHRMAAIMDGKIELVAGAFSSDPKRSKASGKELFLDPGRVYGSYEEMAQKEAALPADERIDFVSIVTPNNSHYPISKVFLEAGFHVVCDKPLTSDLKEAKKLRALVEKTGKVFALTHNYSGNPMVKEARRLVRTGKLGKILKVVSEYPQGWLIDPIEKQGQKQAAWRTDPAQAGASCCVGDIGTHAEHLVRHITGLEIESLCADLTIFGDGRELDDDGNILIRYVGGAKGVLISSQISVGEENNLSVRIYGTKASLEWYQEFPNELIVKFPNAPRQIHRGGNGYNSKDVQKVTRIPQGHPEGYIEAFANIYLEAAKAIGDAVSGRKVRHHDFPTVDDGVMGIAFVATVVKSSRSKTKWTPLIQA